MKRSVSILIADLDHKAIVCSREETMTWKTCFSAHWSVSMLAGLSHCPLVCLIAHWSVSLLTRSGAATAYQ